MSAPLLFQPPPPPPPRNPHRRNRRPPTRRNRLSPHSITTTDNDGSFGLSDFDVLSSSAAHVDSECGSSGIFSYNHSRIESSSDKIDLESGELEMKVHCLGKNEKLCRICHLNFEIYDGDTAEDDGGGEIELGCKCNGDLGAAHKQCAETWFKIKGNL
ncbi:putative Zinc finger, RING-CH-type, Zinc finger, RING/FYVE/PHD-type [Helianthus annuus]|nr:putative Zinc finger, RING-CH-type, Zinc finger, RING/FYVE/PHD-type [Helianthus annuus]